MEVWEEAKMYTFGFVETQISLSSPGTKGNEMLLKI